MTKIYYVLGRSEFAKISSLFNISNGVCDVVIIDSCLVKGKDSRDGAKQVSSIDASVTLISSSPLLTGKKIKL